MANETLLANVINPQVMGKMIDAKINALLKFTPYAKVDTSLVGVAGDTKTVPCWKYIGDAEDVAEGAEVSLSQLTATTTEFKIKKAMKAISISEEARLSGLGNPIGQAEAQLAKSIASKVDNDVLEASLKSKNTVGDGTKPIDYDGIVNCVTKFEDEEDGIEKVMFIHPTQEAELLKDPNFLSADKFTAGVAVKGAIGMIAGCWIKKSKKVKDVGSGVFACPIIKLEPDSAETEETEDELPALTIFLKQDTATTSEFKQRSQMTEVVCSKYYGVALTNEAKVVVGKFKKPTAIV